jgi:hypothetical protein
VSGGGWEDSGNELRAALLGGGVGDADADADADERDVFEAAAVGRKAESRWKKVGVVAKMAGGFGGGGGGAASAGSGGLGGLVGNAHRGAGGKLLGAGNTKTPAKAKTMTFSGGGGGDDDYEEEEEGLGGLPSAAAAQAALAMALALSGKGGGGGKAKAGSARSRSGGASSSGGRASVAPTSKQGGEGGGGSRASSARGGGGSGGGGGGAGGGLDGVAAKLLGTKSVAGAWKRKARIKAIAGGSHAVPRFGIGGADYLVKMTDRMYADQGEFRQFVTPLASERSQASSAAASSMMPPSEVIRGEAEWKHARPPPVAAPAAKTKAASVWQRLNATTKLGKLVGLVAPFITTLICSQNTD